MELSGTVLQIKQFKSLKTDDYVMSDNLLQAPCFEPGILLSAEEREAEGLFRDSCCTFCPALPQLTVLDEAGKHLGLHEDPQETADALWGHRLAESLTLEDALTPFTLGHEQRVMANSLQEEADEGLRH